MPDAPRIRNRGLESAPYAQKDGAPLTMPVELTNSGPPVSTVELVWRDYCAAFAALEPAPEIT
jgi:hypothetical protein